MSTVQYCFPLAWANSLLCQEDRAPVGATEQSARVSFLLWAGCYSRASHPKNFLLLFSPFSSFWLYGASAAKNAVRTDQKVEEKAAFEMGPFATTIAVLQILSLSVSPRWHRTIRPAGVAVLPVHTQVLPTWYCDSTVCSISTVLSIRPILPCCFSPSPDSPAGCYRIGLLFFPLHTHLVLALVSVGSFFLRARYS